MDGFVIGCLIFIAVMCALVFWCRRGVYKYQKDTGCYPAGGMFGKGANEFLSKHPISSRIYNRVVAHGFREWTESEIKSILELGASAVIDSGSFDKDIIVIVPEEMIFVYGKPSDAKNNDDGEYGQIFSGEEGLKWFSNMLNIEGVRNYATINVNVPGKEKSVVGHAIAGGVIAGGAGAVVGAISAASHNSKVSSTKETRYVPCGGNIAYFLKFSYRGSPAARSFFVKSLYTLGNQNIDASFKDTIDSMKYKDLRSFYGDDYTKDCKALVLKLYQNNMTKDITAQSNHRVSLLDE